MTHQLDNISGELQLALRKLNDPIVEYYYSVMPRQQWHVTDPESKDLDRNRGTFSEEEKNQITISNKQRENYLKEINDGFAIIERILKNISLTRKKYQPKKSFWWFQKEPKNESDQIPIKLEEMVEVVEQSVADFLKKVDGFDNKDEMQIMSLKYKFNAVYYDLTKLENYLTKMDKE